MSNHHARPKPATGRDKLLAALVATAVVVAFVVGATLARKRFDQSWPSVTAHVLETRVVVVGTGEGGYGPGAIFYRVEAHVAYEVNGKRFDRWLPASDINRDKAYLELWLSQKKNKLCIVHWNPNNPSDIEAVLT
jgi:hypothetical protein